MKRFVFLLFALVVAMMSWEGQRASGNVMDQGPIPKESIRLRIIANSDSIQDQWLKREVRDAIVQEMNGWVKEIHSYDEAVKLASAKVPELQALVDQTIRDRGFAYRAVVDFGKVPFPTKLYGSYVYPAGDYEAVRVRIGEAKGQNWWCVLFPPLCFIDMSNGDAVRPTTAPPTAERPEENNAETNHPDIIEEEIDNERTEQIQLRRWSEKAVESVDDSVNNNMVTATRPAPVVEVRFYLLDKLAAWF
jgi:stage II sporulation protein R